MFEILVNKGIRDLQYFSKGRRGLIYKGTYKKKQVIVKMKNPESRAINRMQNETRWLRILNKVHIGPTLLFSGKNYFCYEYVDGEFITDFIKKSSKKDILNVLKKIFHQTYSMDKLKVDKEEMHMPFKHILIGKDRVTLLDFERCHIVQRPKNTTQFCQFVSCKRIAPLLKAKHIIINETELRSAAANYKKRYTKKSLETILACMK